MMQNQEIDSPVDRISPLPDEILHHILSLIPNTEDRARTSAISKRFQHLWTHQTSIRLGSTDRFLRLNPDSPDSAPAIDRYLLSVDRCISSLRSPLLRSLDLKLIPSSRSAFRWVRFAADRSVTDLRLGSISGREIRIPQSIFTCRTLVSLDLQACTFRSVPANFRGFPLLTRLKIGGSTISDQTLASLLSRCPSLRSLALSQCWEITNLNLSSANLTELDIFCCNGLGPVRLDAPNLAVISFGGNVAKLFLKDARRLVNVDLCHYNDIHDAGPDFVTPLEWARPVLELQHVSRRLRVTNWLFKFPLPKSPTTTPLFANLKKLNWCTQWVTARLLRGLVPMLAQCPNLEQLYIDLSRGIRSSVSLFRTQLQWLNMTQEEWGQRPDYMDDFENQSENDGVCEVWDSSDFMDDFGDVVPRLKTIIIEAFMGTANEMKMLEYLLDRGKALEKLIIADCLMRDMEEIHHLLDHIPRSSSHVQILEKKMFT